MIKRQEESAKKKDSPALRERYQESVRLTKRREKQLRLQPALG